MDKQVILSFDCANKSLGFTLATIDRRVLEKVRSLIERAKSVLLLSPLDINTCQQLLAEADEAIKGWVVVHACGVMDCLPGKKAQEVKVAERMVGLGAVLDSIDKIMNIVGVKPDVILVEDQHDSLNSLSSSIAAGVCMNYRNYKCIIMNPKLKNSISYSQELQWSVMHAHYLATSKSKNKKRYVTNKKHSLANFYYFIEKIIEKPDIADHVPKLFHDDLADSFQQMMAYVLLVE